jgi:hypothetical protein
MSRQSMKTIKDQGSVLEGQKGHNMNYEGLMEKYAQWVAAR